MIEWGDRRLKCFLSVTGIILKTREGKIADKNARSCATTAPGLNTSRFVNAWRDRRFTKKMKDS